MLFSNPKVVQIYADPWYQVLLKMVIWGLLLPTYQTIHPGSSLEAFSTLYHITACYIVCFWDAWEKVVMVNGRNRMPY